ncbi:hypothetical protein ACS0TY_027908 [Phlomoides rotata]
MYEGGAAMYEGGTAVPMLVAQAARGGRNSEGKHASAVRDRWVGRGAWRAAGFQRECVTAGEEEREPWRCGYNQEDQDLNRLPYTNGVLGLGLGKNRLEADKEPILPICWKGVKPFKSVHDAASYFKPLVLSFTNAKNVQLQLRPESYLIVTDMFEEKRSFLEPAGALALAGPEAYCKYLGLKGANVIAVTSGANMNFDRLRLVTELADVGRLREAVHATYMPEESGCFTQFFELISLLIYLNLCILIWSRMQVEVIANVVCSVGLLTDLELEAMIHGMESAQLQTMNLTKNLMGGRSNVKDELLCRFIFPERPGALMKFLDALSPRWNISLFHYRGQGATGANALVGIQVAPMMERYKDFPRKFSYAEQTGGNKSVVNLRQHLTIAPSFVEPGAMITPKLKQAFLEKLDAKEL